VGRSREFALRLALGASTPRLTRQTLTESLVLAVGAGAAGVALAVVGLRLLIALAPGSIPRLDELGIDGPVLMYATIVSLLVGVIFGLTPALGLGRGTLAAALREGIGPAGGQRGQRLRGVLIVFQFALAMILVFGASLLIRSLMEANRVDAGFRSDDVIMANLSVPEPERRSVFYEQLVQEVPTIPGVRSAAIVEDLFLSGAPNRAITVEGGESAEPGLVSLRVDAIAGDFFGTIGVALRQGRAFLPSDGAETVPVAIVNETMAQRFWPGESPIGKRFRIGPAGPDNGWLEVVGLVGDMRRQGPETPPIAQLFRPYSQAPSRNMVLLVRTLSPEADLTAAIRTRVAAIDGTVPLYGTTTVNEALDRFLVQRRFQSSLLGLFSGIALILAAVGIYGLIQYSVLQRTREIGVRMALGGTPQQVTALILRQGLSVALPGLALGMVCALMLAEAVSALLFGVAAADLTNILITAGILLATTVVACYLPARRAAAILPMTALRR
jgi:putative ABC transport system permease protein